MPIHTSLSQSFTPLGLWSSLQVGPPIYAEAVFVHTKTTLLSPTESCRIHAAMRLRDRPGKL
jgi:hypothetical protein